MKKITLLGIVALLVFGNCSYKATVEPAAPVLPDISYEGKNIFGCMANGQVWQNAGTTQGPYSSTIQNTIFSLFYIYQKKDNANLTLKGRMTYANSDQNFEFTILNKELPKTGAYQVKICQFNDLLKRIDYISVDSLKPFYVNIIKFDTTNKIVSGTFDGTLFTQFTKEKMLISKGRFDVKYDKN